MERINGLAEELAKKEKSGLTKEQKEEKEIVLKARKGGGYEGWGGRCTGRPPPPAGPRQPTTTITCSPLRSSRPHPCAPSQIKEWLEAGKDVRFGDWNLREVEFLNANPLISAKPVREEGRDGWVGVGQGAGGGDRPGAWDGVCSDPAPLQPRRQPRAPTPSHPLAL